MLLLKQDTIKKSWVDENNIIELNVSKNRRKYKIEAICNNTVYIKELASNLPGLYYLVFLKD